MDFDIHVWDIRRPYIPYASFSEHKDVVTGTDSCVRDVKMLICLYSTLNYTAMICSTGVLPVHSDTPNLGTCSYTSER